LSSVMYRSARMLVKKLMQRMTRQARCCSRRVVRSR
jgi:hypothetical protein